MGRRILESHGYKVHAVENADAALLLLDRDACEIDLLLTDVVMPLMSGPDLAARATAMRPGLPVMYMSGYSDTAVLRGEVLNQRNFIAKPYTKQELVTRVAAALGRGEAPPADVQP